MKRLMIPAILFLSICPLLAAQQSSQGVSALPIPQPAQSVQITGSLQLTQAAQEPVEEPLLTNADLDHGQILKNARTLCIFSDTDFLSPATLSRALLNQKDWEKLGLSIVENQRYVDPHTSKPRAAELQLQIDRVIFTHIHTYVLTERATGVVLASGRVRAFDGVVASGPMAEQIVKILSAARVPALATNGNPGS
jgi:hypothetical protein